MTPRVNQRRHSMALDLYFIDAVGVDTRMDSDAAMSIDMVDIELGAGWHMPV